MILSGGISPRQRSTPDPACTPAGRVFRSLPQASNTAPHTEKGPLPLFVSSAAPEIIRHGKAQPLSASRAQSRTCPDYAEARKGDEMKVNLRLPPLIPIFVVLSIRITLHIFDESAIAFILERNLVNFVKHKESSRTHRLVLVSRHGSRFASCPPNTGVRHCLFVFGFTRTSVQIDDRASHFLFV